MPVRQARTLICPGGAEVTPEDGDLEGNQEDLATGPESGEGDAGNSEDGTEAPYKDGEIVIDWFDLPEIETSAPEWSAFSVNIGQYVTLKDATAVKWIDRINIPDYARTFYESMESGKRLIEAAGNEIEAARLPYTSNINADEVYAYLFAAMQALDRDHPEMFWIADIGQVGYGSQNGELVFYVKYPYKNQYANADAVKAEIANRDDNIAKILSEIPAGASAYDKIVIFNNWLTHHNEYNTDLNGAEVNYPNAWECVSALAGQTGKQGPVCEGYARAFKVLCDRVGIPCVLVDGTAESSNGSGGAHMWNYVQLEGAWYGVDVTWNDPVVTNGSGGAVSGHESGKWLLVGSGTEIDGISFLASHPVSNKVSSTSIGFTNGPILNPTKYVKKNLEVKFESPTLSVTYSGKAAEITGANLTVTIDGTAVDNPDITYSYRKSGDSAFIDGLPVDAGTYDIKAKVAGRDGSFSATESSNTLTLTIEKATVQIKVKEQHITYGDTFVGGASMVDCAGLVSGDNLADIKLSYSGVNAGDYPLVPSNAAIKNGNRDVTGNYTINYSDGTLHIDSAPYNVTVSEKQFIVLNDGNFQPPSFTDKNGNPVEGTIKYTYGSQTYTAYSELVSALKAVTSPTSGTIGYEFIPDGNNYNGNKSGTITFDIVTVNFTVGSETASDQNAVTVKKNPVYGDTWNDILTLNPSLTATLADVTDTTGFRLNVTGTDAPSVGQQSFQVLYSGTISGNQFTNVVVCTGTVTVGKAALTVTANDQTITYGEAPKDNGVTYSGFVNGEDEKFLTGTLIYTHAYNQYDKVANYEITPAGLNSNNYDITYAKGMLIVKKRVVTLEWQNAGEDRFYNDGKAVTATAGNLVNNDTVTVEVTGGDAQAVGTHTAKATALSGTNAVNYALPDNAAKEYMIKQSGTRVENVTTDKSEYTYGETITVGAKVTMTNTAARNVTPADGQAALFYGETQLSQAVAVKEDGTVTISYQTTDKKATIGSQELTVRFLGTENLAASSAAKTVKVNAKPLTAGFQGTAVKPYDGTTSSTGEGITAELEGILSGDIVLVSAKYAYETAAVGKCKVKISDIALSGADAKWYSLNTKEAEGDWGEIQRRKVTVKADAKSKVYGTKEDPALTYQAEGVVEGEALSGSLIREAGETVKEGGYGILQGTLTDANNPNYTISFVGAAMTIQPKAVALIWSGEFATIYDGKEHGITAVVDKDDLVGGDKVQVVGYENNSAVSAGTYVARAIALDNGNYTVGAETSTKEWRIEAKSISDAVVTLADGGLTYNGKPQTKEVVSVVLKGADGKAVTLVKGTDYTVANDTNTNAGSYILQVKGTGNYTGTVPMAYDIAKAVEPDNVPSAGTTNIMVPSNVESMEDVTLPDGWVWENPKTEPVPGGKIEVKAVHKDAENYEKNYEVTYLISKNPEVIEETDYEYSVSPDGKLVKSYEIGEDEGIIIKSTGALEKLQTVELDGQIVDAANYTLKSGSTILNFKKAYMDGLSVGEHSVRLTYEVGNVEVLIHVSETKDEETDIEEPNQAGSSTSGTKLSPKTGEETPGILYLLPLFAVLMVVSAYADRRSRKKN